MPIPIARPVKPARVFCQTWECPSPLPAPRPAFKRLSGSQLFDCVSNWLVSVGPRPDRGCIAIPIQDLVVREVKDFLSTVLACPANGQGSSLDTIQV